MFNPCKGSAMPILSSGRVLPLLILVFALSTCDSVRENFDTTRKNPPDEFVVVAQPPLSLPPSYGLRPPAPGAPRPQTGTATDQARAAVFTRDQSEAAAAAAAAAAVADRSSGEQALLRKAGAAAASSGFVDTLIFWRESDEPGEIIDPQAEQRRLQENEALGRAVTEGETPVIERRKRAIFEGIF